MIFVIFFRGREEGIISNGFGFKFFWPINMFLNFYKVQSKF